MSNSSSSLSGNSGGGRQENGESAVPMSDPMEMTPPPEVPPGAFPTTNGVNGEHGRESTDGEEGPVPPPHRTPTSPEPEVPKVDAEACKAAGNKFYKAGQYDKAIAEYTKGLLCQYSSDRMRLVS
jgi:DnaJ family protein C protein 7